MVYGWVGIFCFSVRFLFLGKVIIGGELSVVKMRIFGSFERVFLCIKV